MYQLSMIITMPLLAVASWMVVKTSPAAGIAPGIALLAAIAAGMALCALLSGALWLAGRIVDRRDSVWARTPYGQAWVAHGFSSRGEVKNLAERGFTPQYAGTVTARFGGSTAWKHCGLQASGVAAAVELVDAAEAFDPSTPRAIHASRILFNGTPAAAS